MQRAVLILFILLFPIAASAHIPLIVVPEHVDDAHRIESPHISQAFYGNLEGFPHAYTVVADGETELSLEILVPDIDSAKDIVSGIVVKQLKRGGVEEVTRLHAKDASWESFFEPWGADTYRKGPGGQVRVGQGSYLIEVSTPNNLEPYVLVVGVEENFGDIGYVETIRRMVEVKAFFGKSKLRVIESPLVFFPLSLTILLLGALIFGYRKWYSGRNIQ